MILHLTSRTSSAPLWLQGWFGNHSDWNISVTTLTRLTECPSVRIKFKKEKIISWQQPKMRITRPVYPSGSCCEVGIVTITILPLPFETVRASCLNIIRYPMTSTFYVIRGLDNLPLLRKVNELKQSLKQIQTPAKAATQTIDGILVAVYQEKYHRNIDGFKVFLSNRESASFFLQQKFNMEGSPLELNRQPPGYHQYRLKGRL